MPAQLKVFNEEGVRIDGEFARGSLEKRFESEVQIVRVWDGGS
jgi:hypothetical protein